MARTHRIALLLRFLAGLSMSIGVLFLPARVLGQVVPAANEHQNSTALAPVGPDEKSHGVSPDASAITRQQPAANEVPKSINGERRAVQHRLATMLKTLESIKGGSLKFTREVVHIGEPATRQLLASEGFMAFHFDRQLIRFDHQNVRSTGRDDAEQRTSVSKFIRSGEDSFRWDPMSDTIRHYRSDEDWPRYYDCEPFDVRVAGIGGLSFWRWPKTFEDARRFLQRDGTQEIELGSPGWPLLVSSGIAENSRQPWRWSILLDPSRDCVPLRFEYWLTRRPAPDTVFQLHQAVDVAWVRFQDVYVPNRLEFLRNNRDGSKLLDRFHLSWQSVSQDLSDRLFSVEDFAAPEGTLLVDYRTEDEEGRIERRLGPPGRHTAARWAPRDNIDVGGDPHREPPVPLKERIANALEQPIRFDFIDVPLSQVLLFYRDITKIPIRFDPDLPAGSNPNRELCITCKGKNVPLSDALDLTLKDSGFTYSVRDDGILITTEPSDR